MAVNVNLPCENEGGLDPTLYVTREELQGYLKYVFLTQDEYDNLPTKEEHTLYLIPEED